MNLVMKHLTSERGNRYDIQAGTRPRAPIICLKTARILFRYMREKILKFT